jgi:PhnB protein
MKNTTIQPYLMFGGRCEEAVTFYRAALGAQADTLMRYKDSPEPLPPGMVPAGWENKIMHATLRVSGTTFMASDGCEPGLSFAGFSLHLCVPTTEEAGRVFTALADGGRVRMPLNKTFWSPCFGMLADRFGVGWMVSVES